MSEVKEVAASPREGSPKAARVMFGDLMNGICFTAFLPVYLYLWQTQGAPGSGPTCLAFVATTLCCWLSYLKQSPIWSALAMACMCTSIACMNLYQWPHPDVIIVPQFTWCLLIIAANQSLTLRYRIALAVLAAVNALGIVMVLQAFDKIPLLLASSSICVLALFYYHRQPEGTLISANAASLVLAGSFAYYVSYEIVSMYADTGYTTTGGYNILRIGFFAAAGLAASGSFQQEIAFKKALEIQVAQRSQEMQAQADKLRKVERALQASETAIAIISTASDPQTLEWANTAFYRLTGQPVGDNPCFWGLLRLRPEDRAKLTVMLNDAHNKDLAEITLGTQFFEVEVTSLEDNKGHAMVVLKDVTEQKARLQAEQLAERQALVARTMNESMQTLSHELRTPLQGIMGMTSLLLEDDEIELPQEAHECMSMVMTSSRLLLTLINNMLDTRKCDAGRMDEFRLGPVPLSPSFQDATAFCQPFATISGVTLAVEEIDPLWSVQGNPLRLQQVMINLISNSIKYGPENSTVSVSSRIEPKRQVDQHISEKALAVGCQDPSSDEGNVVVVTVRDEGKGIRVENSNRLFGRFAQFSEHDAPNRGSVGQPSGTGLGLSLCAEFVGRMKGQIWAHNIPEGGCEFSFYLPVGDALQVGVQPMPVVAPESNITVVQPHNTSPKAKIVISNLRVLLVDDTNINLKVFRRMLEKLHVGTIAVADSGEKALALATVEPFDLVITDLHMPGMQGTDLSVALLSDENLPQRPVIVGITADQGEQVEEECRAAGMSLVLHKPITQHGLGEFFEQFAKSMG